MISPTPLTSAQVDSVEPERKAQEILNEWLKSYFNGATHTVADVARAFPDLSGENAPMPNGIFFNQTELPGTLTGVIIHWIFADLRSVERMESETSKLITVDFISTVYVRGSAAAMGNILDFNVRRVADLLRAIILSPERCRLNQAGIHRIRCPRGPIPVDVPGWQSRMLVVSGQLQYRVEWES